MDTVLLFLFTSPCSIGILLPCLQPYTYPEVLPRFSLVWMISICMFQVIYMQEGILYMYHPLPIPQHPFNFLRTQYCPGNQNNLVAYFTSLIIRFLSHMGGNSVDLRPQSTFLTSTFIFPKALLRKFALSLTFLSTLFFLFPFPVHCISNYALHCALQFAYTEINILKVVKNV